MQPAAPAHEVVLWYAEYGDFAHGDVLPQLDQLLDAEEQTRRDRFLFERDRRSFTISHGVLRLVLSNYRAVPPQAWRFECNNYGKPYIVEPGDCRGLRFNLSHTRGAALCGISSQFEIGVDIEAMERDASCLELADRYFSPTEVAALRALPAERRRDRFFELWTLKEAYIKARGMGLAIPLDQFSYLLSSSTENLGSAPPRISFTPPLVDRPEAWQFVERRMGPQFRAAAAAQCGPGVDVRFVWRKLLPNMSGESVELL